MNRFMGQIKEPFRETEEQRRRAVEVSDRFLKGSAGGPDRSQLGTGERWMLQPERDYSS
jgi:hypothetical protein